MINALTVDVEDYFHVSAFENSIDPRQWNTMPQRALINTRRILDIFEEAGVRGTFFVLGWVAQRHPSLVRAIASKGHEIACHGYNHQRVTAMTPQSFRNDVRKAKALLEDISGCEVTGYRAPSWTIVPETLWALDVLIEEGFLYDSSIFPIHHDIYGMPQAPRHPHRIERESGNITEFPPSTLPLNAGGKKLNLPVSGGGYLRLFPAALMLKAARYINTRESVPTVLYFHPWEIDPEQPRVKAPLKSRFRHYLNLDRMENKLRYLLSELSYAPMREVLHNMDSAIAQIEGNAETRETTERKETGEAANAQ